MEGFQQHRVSFMQNEKGLEMLHSNVNIVNTTKLYSQKWLRGKLCIMGFLTTDKKKNFMEDGRFYVPLKLNYYP